MASPSSEGFVARITSLDRLARLLGRDHALQQLADPQALGADAVHRADRPVEDVVAAPPLPGPLDREHVERLLDDAQATRRRGPGRDRSGTPARR